MKTLKLFLVLMFVVFAFSGAYSQTPSDSLRLTVLNNLFAAEDSVTFEYWLKNDRAVPIYYLYGQYHANISKAWLGVTSGATLRILESGLPSAYVPRNPSLFYGTGDTVQMRMAPNSSPGIGNGFMLAPGASIMIARGSLRLPSGSVYMSGNWQFYWRKIGMPSPRVVIGLDLDGVAAEYTKVAYTNPPPCPPLPVNLASFTASTFDKRDVKLTWTTSQELNNSGFDIERKTLEGQYSKVGFVKGKGTTNSPTTYTFEDKKLNSGKYNYRLKQIDYNGNYEYFELSSSIEIGLPTKYDLSQNYPNPFNPSTKIDYDLPFDSHVSLKIYDMTGREVMSVINNETQQAGFYTIQLNASNLASGTYFFRLIANDNIFTKRMVLLK